MCNLTWNYLIKNLNLTDTNFHWKNYIDWIFDTWWDNILQPEKWTFCEKNFFSQNRWDKGDMIQKLCVISHGITSLKTWILQIQTSTGKINLIEYLILGEIKLCNLKNEHFVRKPFSHKIDEIRVTWFRNYVWFHMELPH